MPTSVQSHAKINLGLYIGAPRADGFHGLATVYQTLEMHEVVRVWARRAGESRIELKCGDARVPTDERNTAWKMLALALDALGVKAEVSIEIEKRLPVQGGLGAGSANAAAALVGLERELGIPATGPEGHAGREWLSRRLELAARVGSDVPLFLLGGAVLGTDRGQQVAPLPDVGPVWCVVALPEVGVSTPEAFQEWDLRCAREGLTEAASADTLKELSRAYASAFAGAIPEGGGRAGSSGVLSEGKDPAGPQASELVRTGILSWIRNDFEQVVFSRHPSLAEIKQTLAAADSPEAALHASLSGSGSALFGLYASRRHAEAALERLKAAGVGAELTRTLPRRDYRRNMLSAG